MSERDSNWPLWVVLLAGLLGFLWFARKFIVALFLLLVLRLWGS